MMWALGRNTAAISSQRSSGGRSRSSLKRGGAAGCEVRSSVRSRSGASESQPGGLPCTQGFCPCGCAVATSVIAPSSSGTASLTPAEASIGRAERLGAHREPSG